MNEAQPFPWEEVTAFGLSVLRWSPSEFWHATPREVAAALEGLQGGRKAEPARRGDLERLMEAFPDG